MLSHSSKQQHTGGRCCERRTSKPRRRVSARYTSIEESHAIKIRKNMKKTDIVKLHHSLGDYHEHLERNSKIEMARDVNAVMEELEEYVDREMTGESVEQPKGPLVTFEQVGKNQTMDFRTKNPNMQKLLMEVTAVLTTLVPKTLQCVFILYEGIPKGQMFYMSTVDWNNTNLVLKELINKYKESPPPGGSTPIA